MAPVIDWLDILRQNGIEYVERGKNVKRGEVAIHCPFCGSADPSHHLGLNLETGWWACWRNNTHRGKSPVRLLVQLLRISYWKAREIAGVGDDYLDPDGFDAVAARILGRNQTMRMEEVRREFLDFPREFTPLDIEKHKRWSYYLLARGFPVREQQLLCRSYNLMASLTGSFQDRVILPYYVNKELVAWTGRAIAPATIRYKDLSIDECLIPPKETLYNYDCIAEGGKALLVVEGPFDVLKLDFYGREYGVRAVGLSTNSMTEEQMFLIEEASEQFEQTIIMMDTQSELGVIDSLKMKERIAHIPNLKISGVPYNYKDGGEMPPRMVVNYSRRLVSENIHQV